MGKYDPLRDSLRAAPDEIEWAVEDLSRLVGGLPASAREHPAWWGNEHTHVQSAAWLSAGYRVEAVDLVGGRVRFRRANRTTA
jgi:hypothetical protein